MKRFFSIVLCLAITGFLFSDSAWEALAATPPMGWNSWNAVEGNVCEKVILETADAFVNGGLKDAGYEYIVIDDIWALKERNEKGELVANPQKFPNGIRFVADYLHSKGLKLGIYSDAGKMTCAGTQPGSYRYEEIDAALFASWGVDYLKYDYCNAPANKKTAIQRYKAMGDALKKQSRPIVYSVCEWGVREPWEWAKSVGGHLWRTSFDMRDNWEFSQEVNRKSEFWIGVLDGIDLQLGLEKYNGPGGWNDPDMLVIGVDLAGSSKGGNAKGLNEIEEKTMFSFWCLFSAPLMHNNDLRKLDPQNPLYDKQWAEKVTPIITNKNLISVNQDKLGVQGTRVYKENGIDVWKKPLSTGETVLAVLNRNETEQKVTVDFSKLGNNNQFYIHNLWSGEKSPTQVSRWEGVLKPHETVMLKLR